MSPRWHMLWCWTSSTALFIILPDDFTVTTNVQFWPLLLVVCACPKIFKTPKTGSVTTVWPLLQLFLCIPTLQTGTVPSNFHAPPSSPGKCASLLIPSCWDIREWGSCEAGCQGWRHQASLGSAGHPGCRLAGASYAALEFASFIYCSVAPVESKAGHCMLTHYLYR